MDEWAVFGVITTVMAFAGIIYKATQSANRNRQNTTDAIHQLTIVTEKLNLVIDNVIEANLSQDVRLGEHRGELIRHRDCLSEHDKWIEANRKDIDLNRKDIDKIKSIKETTYKKEY